MKIVLYTPESSNIESIEYDKKLKELTIIFNNESEYLYKNVAVEVFIGFITAESVGKYSFSNIVRGGYEFEKTR